MGEYITEGGAFRFTYLKLLGTDNGEWKMKFPVSVFFHDARKIFKLDALGLEILQIALPTALAFAADPVASLIDTAFIGRLGPVPLAAVGVSIAIFNQASKVTIFPLVSITTSFVAEEDTFARMKSEVSVGDELQELLSENMQDSLEEGSSFNDATKKLLPAAESITIATNAPNHLDNIKVQNEKRHAPSASTALLLACILGFLQAILLIFLAKPILCYMGVNSDSSMLIPAQRYLTLRSLGAPAVLLSLAMQGIFRGLKDTKTPLYATVAGDVMNIILDPILIFSFHLGVSGAAVAHVLSQYLISLILLCELVEKVHLIPPSAKDLQFGRFLKNGTLLLARVIAVTFCVTLAASMAARLGTRPMAAFQICLQVWMTSSLLADGLAVAGQAILASAFAEKDYKKATAAATRVLQMGFVLGLGLSVVVGLGLHFGSVVFTEDIAVLYLIRIGIPFVAVTQPINCLAFVFDGVNFGASDFVYSAISMVLVAIVSIASLFILSKSSGFIGIWLALAIYMGLRAFAGVWRFTYLKLLGTDNGEWKMKFPVSVFFHDARKIFKLDALGLEILQIALPTALAIATDPVASLIDTAFIGRLGPVPLAAVGVSIAIFNQASRVTIIPLVKITTSFVAEEDAFARMKSEVSVGDELQELLSENMQDSMEEGSSFNDETKKLLPEAESITIATNAPNHLDSIKVQNEKRHAPSASIALLLACILGFLQAILLIFLAKPILRYMGVNSDSSMLIPAQRYLTLRSLGSPAVLLSLAMQGIFRGLKDAKTPLYATVAGDVMNIILDPILIFSFHLGVSGAAVAHVLSQYLISLILLCKLVEKVHLIPPSAKDLQFGRFLKNGTLLLARVIAVTFCVTLAASMAARLGTRPMAAFQICLQVWMTSSLLADGLSVAGQAILASAFAEKDYKKATAAATRVLQMGFVLGLGLSVVVGLGLHFGSVVFTEDKAALYLIRIGIPFVAATQPINCLAFVFDGVNFGASDFVYSTISMVLVAIVSIASLFILSKSSGFIGIWLALAIYMGLRAFAGVWRMGTGTGPWCFLRHQPQK